MMISEITLFQIARDKFGEQTATDFVAAIKQIVDTKFEEKMDVLATKKDVAEVKQELYEVKAELTKTIYLVGLSQFIAIIISLLAIMDFMK